MDIDRGMTMRVALLAFLMAATVASGLVAAQEKRAMTTEYVKMAMIAVYLAILLAVAIYGLHRYVLVYQALQATRGLYAAESRDGRKWKMLNGGEPILSPGEPGDFDAAILGHPCLLVEADRVRMWYTGFRREPADATSYRVRIGAAELTLQRTRIIEHEIEQ